MTLRPTLKSKRTRTFVLFFLLFLLLPFSFQCVKTPLDFKAPQWSVPLNIQLIDRTFTFGQMIEKDPKFITDSTTSHVEYRPSSIVNSPTAIVLPELTPTASSVSNKLGLVPLSVPTIPNVAVGFKDIFGIDPPAFPYPGSDTSVAMNNNIANPGATYDYLVFENGRMSLTITNTFPFAISFQAPGVRLINIDQDLAVVATFAFPTINAGQSNTQTADVSGKLMSANLKMSFVIQTSGINGKTIASSDKVTAQLSIDGGSTGSTATLKRAKVQLNTDYPVSSIPDSAVQLIDDSTKIKRAEFKDGQFKIEITNSIDTKIVVGFALNEFVKRSNGAPFKLKDDITQDTTGVIPAKSKFTQTVNMVDYAIQSQKDTIIGGKKDTLAVPNVHFSINIKTLAATQGRVVISKDDSVRVDISPQFNNQQPPAKTYVLEKVVGKVKPTPVPINQTVDAAVGELGNKFTADSIKFDSVSITLKILSTGSFPTDLAMKIVGLDKNGVRRDSLIAREVRGGVLSDTLRINPGVEKKIVFDKSTSTGGRGIDQFLSSFFSGGSGSLPQQFIVTGRALVDPPSYYQYPESTGTVKAGDSVYTSVEFKFPVRVGIINGTYKDTITISDTSGNKIDKESLAQIDSGKVIFTINNAFPFQLDVGTKLLPALATDKSKPDTSRVLLLLPKVGEIRADSARYASKPDAPVSVTGTVIGLTPDDVDKINPASFVALSIKLKTAGNDIPVEFKKDYYVRLKAFVSVRFNVNFDKLK